jgi:succinylarginine dihydrolase
MMKQHVAVADGDNIIVEYAMVDSLRILPSVEVPDEQVSLDDAVASYLFNSQLLSKADGKMLSFSVASTSRCCRKAC